MKAPTDEPVPGGSVGMVGECLTGLWFNLSDPEVMEYYLKTYGKPEKTVRHVWIKIDPKHDL